MIVVKTVMTLCPPVASVEVEARVVSDVTVVGISRPDGEPSALLVVVKEVLPVVDAGEEPVPVAAPVLEELDAGKGTEEVGPLPFTGVEV